MADDQTSPTFQTCIGVLPVEESGMRVLDAALKAILDFLPTAHLGAMAAVETRMAEVRAEHEDRVREAREAIAHGSRLAGRRFKL